MVHDTAVSQVMPKTEQQSGIVSVEYKGDHQFFEAL